MYAFWLGVTAYDEAKKFWIGGRHGGRERGDAGEGREGRGGERKAALSSRTRRPFTLHPSFNRMGIAGRIPLEMNQLAVSNLQLHRGT